MVGNVMMCSVINIEKIAIVLNRHSFRIESSYIVFVIVFVFFFLFA